MHILYYCNINKRMLTKVKYSFQFCKRFVLNIRYNNSNNSKNLYNIFINIRKVFKIN